MGFKEREWVNKEEDEKLWFVFNANDDISNDVKWLEGDRFLMEFLISL